MAITYVNGRLVRTSEGDRAIAAAKIEKQLREENEARLKGLEKQQKSYVPPKVVKDENPPPAGDGAPAPRKVNANMTP